MVGRSGPAGDDLDKQGIRSVFWLPGPFYELSNFLFFYAGLLQDLCFVRSAVVVANLFIAAFLLFGAPVWPGLWNSENARFRVAPWDARGGWMGLAAAKHQEEGFDLVPRGGWYDKECRGVSRVVDRPRDAQDTVVWMLLAVVVNAVPMFRQLKFDDSKVTFDVDKSLEPQIEAVWREWWRRSGIPRADFKEILKAGEILEIAVGTELSLLLEALGWGWIYRLWYLPVG
eukprot:Skav209087  [mRNA]  locus=scaffold207:753479:755722:- [translate_table: standard]